MEEIKKVYYSISEVAELFNVRASTLRYWERPEAFDMELHSKLTRNSRFMERRYIDEDLILIYFIHYYLTVDLFTIPGAKRQLERIGMLR